MTVPQATAPTTSALSTPVPHPPVYLSPNLLKDQSPQAPAPLSGSRLTRYQPSLTSCLFLSEYLSLSKDDVADSSTSWYHVLTS